LNPRDNAVGFVQSVLPNPDDSPASSFKQTANFAVPGLISRDFCMPKIRSRFRHPTMTFATVPKTTIDKDRNTPASKNKVRLAWQGLFSPPSVYSMSSKNGNKPNLGSLVSAAFDQ
jgi:hypothetical protein